MDEHALVTALVHADQRGLEGVYRTYADRLYTYCCGVLQDAGAAAEVVLDTFVVAHERAAHLGDPDRLPAWLYALAGKECLRLLHGHTSGPALEGDAGAVDAPAAGRETAAPEEPVRELVWAAAGGLSPASRQAFELSMRLPATEAGAALGVPADRARKQVSRAGAALERALEALLVVRAPAPECAELAQLLQGWDGAFTASLHRRIGRHLESCVPCAARRRGQPRPAALLSEYAALPPLAAPAEIWVQLQLTCFVTKHGLIHQRTVQRFGPFIRGTGFPLSYQAHRRRRRSALGAAAAGVAVLVAGGVLLLPSLARTGPPPQGWAPEAIATASPGTTALGAAGAAGPGPVLGPARAPGATNAPGSAGTAPGPAGVPAQAVLPGQRPSPGPGTTPPAAAPVGPVSPEVTAGPSPQPGPPPSPGVAPPSVPPLAVHARARIDCASRPDGYLLDVSAETTQAITTARLVALIGNSRREYPMAVDGPAASVLAGPNQAAQMSWWVEVAAADGRTARTESVSLNRPCGPG